MGGGYAPSPENFSLLTFEKAHFGAYPMRSDVLILKLWFAVHRMMQGCGTDSVSFFSVRLQFMGAYPLAHDKLRPCLSPFSSPVPTFPLPSLSLNFLLLSRQIDEVFIRCGLFTVMCTMGLHLSRSICMIRLKIEVSTTVIAC